MEHAVRLRAEGRHILLSRTIPAAEVRSIDILLSAEDVIVRRGEESEIRIVQYSDGRDVDDKYIARVIQDGDTLTVSLRPRGIGWIGLQWAFLPRMTVEVSVPETFGGRIHAETFSGDAEASGIQALEFKLSTKSGDVRAQDLSVPILEAATVSGDAVLTRCSGDMIRMSSVSGDIRAGLKEAHEVYAKTISGDVDVSIAEATNIRKIEAKTVSGDVKIGLPSGVSANADFHSVSGRSRIVPEGGGEIVLSAAGIPVRASTTSGDIALVAC